MKRIHLTEGNTFHENDHWKENKCRQEQRTMNRKGLVRIEKTKAEITE